MSPPHQDAPTPADRERLRLPEGFGSLPAGGDEENLIDVRGGQSVEQRFNESASHAPPLMFGTNSHLCELESVGGMETLDIAEDEPDAFSVVNRGQSKGTRSRQNLSQPLSGS